MIKSILLVGLGGALGSVARYLVAIICNRYLPDNFAYGTFLANIAGSLLIGVLLGYLLRDTGGQHLMRLFLVTGFCGGFTTFSTFSYENMQYLTQGNLIQFMLYGFGSVALGILAAFAGVLLSKMF